MDSGKSSVGRQYLPESIQNTYPIVDGDLLFVKKLRELFPRLTPSPKEAKKLAFEFVVDTFEQLTEEALSTRESFVYEGHFTNEATWDTPRRFKTSGYEINLIFFGLLNPDVSQLRVTD